MSSYYGAGMTSSFKEVASALGDLVEEKNKAYGDATRTGAEAMRLLFPNGVQPDRYEDLGYCLLVWHKLSRVATQPDAFGENPKQDIAGYSVLALAREKDNKRGNPEESCTFTEVVKAGAKAIDDYINKSPIPTEHLTAEVCPKCRKEMGEKPAGFECWTCFYVDSPTLLATDGADWKYTANARELEEVQRLFVLGMTDDGKGVVVGGQPRPPLGDLTDRWDAGCYEGTGKGYERVAPRQAAYKVGDKLPPARVSAEVLARYTGYWLTVKRDGYRYWVITGIK